MGSRRHCFGGAVGGEAGEAPGGPRTAPPTPCCFSLETSILPQVGVGITVTTPRSVYTVGRSFLFILSAILESSCYYASHFIDEEILREVKASAPGHTASQPQGGLWTRFVELQSLRALVGPPLPVLSFGLLTVRLSFCPPPSCSSSGSLFCFSKSAFFPSRPCCFPGVSRSLSLCISSVCLLSPAFSSSSCWLLPKDHLPGVQPTPSSSHDGPQGPEALQEPTFPRPLEVGGQLAGGLTSATPQPLCVGGSGEGGGGGADSSPVTSIAVQVSDWWMGLPGEPVSSSGKV